MAGGTNQELIQGLLSKAKRELRLSLAAHDAQLATQQLRAAQQLTAHVERMVLANPMSTDQDLAQIVAFSRGTLWSEAHAHLTQLSN